MRVECSCLGENANCYRCFGNGYYPKDGSLSSQPKRRTRPRVSRSTRNEFRQWATSDVQVERADQKAVIQVVVSFRKAQHYGWLDSVVEFTGTTRIDFFLATFRAIDGRRPADQVKPIALVPLNPKTKRTRITKGKNSKPFNPAQDASNVANFSDTGTIDENSGALNPEQGLDTTKDYSRFRENGRFGSHPLHDNYD